MKKIIIAMLVFVSCLPLSAQRRGGSHSSYQSSKRSTSTQEYRYVPQSTKREMRRDAGYSPSDRNAVIDHKVPLELGGSNRRSNLQVQPRNESIKKDRLENKLTRQVQQGKLSMPDAQRRINQGPVKSSQLRSPHSSKSRKH